MPKAKRNPNRILSVTVKRILDTDPDLSYLGEYTNKVESDYTIDRRHTRECNAQNGQDFQEAESMLSRVVSRLEDGRTVCEEPIHTTGDCESCKQEWAEQESVDLVQDIQDNLAECDCGGQFIDRNSFKYFKPNHENYDGLTEEEIRTYCWQDFERMESYENQNWYCLGIRAEAEIAVDQHSQTITSGGIWGTESDSDDDYLASLETDELADLRGQLRALGFSTRAITKAFQDVQHKEA